MTWPADLLMGDHAAMFTQDNETLNNDALHLLEGKLSMYPRSNNIWHHRYSVALKFNVW
jgi:hypothetical protein